MVQQPKFQCMLGSKHYIINYQNQGLNLVLAILLYVLLQYHYKRITYDQNH